MIKRNLNVVLLVDHKNRDLRGSALIAKHLRDDGIAAHLEPINAWQAVLGAYKPDLILFNHVLRKHLVDYTERLGKMGVLTAVLPNEGLLYNDEIRAYNSGRQYPNIHLDYYFCWNQPHQECLYANGYRDQTDVRVTGVPRFDYYFEPWSRIFPASPRSGRPRILVCTNFSFAEWFGRPRELADRFFSQWKNHISHYEDHWNAIEVSHRSRLKFLTFLQEIALARKYDVVLKTHPREERGVYERWMQTLPADARAHFTYAPADAQITALILGCDLEISCEKCTTALESWVASKPTLELIFERHTAFYDAAFSALNPNCESPQDVVPMIDAALAEPGQRRFQAGRQAHLARWCNSPRGDSALNVARVIAEGIRSRARSKHLALGFHDWRRAAKLKAYRAIGKPYTFFPLHKLPQRLFGTRNPEFSKKLMIYKKSVTPALAEQTLSQLDQLTAGRLDGRRAA